MFNNNCLQGIAYNISLVPREYPIESRTREIKLRPLNHVHRLRLHRRLHEPFLILPHRGTQSRTTYTNPIIVIIATLTDRKVVTRFHSLICTAKAFPITIISGHSDQNPRTMRACP